MQIYLFNPENDLALANFSPNYTPPASAVRMAGELAVLPIWYAGMDAGTGEGQMVVAGGESNRSFLEAVGKLLPVRASLIPLSGIASYPRGEIVPWGWNPALRKKLAALVADPQSLPSTEELTRLRDYSNRRHAVEVLHELHAGREGLCGESHFFTGTDELGAWLESLPGDKVLKMPLSGSGKGLAWVLGGITGKQRDWCRRVVREQGGVVAEPVLAKVRDFAMEFYLHGGNARFAGYSMFSTAPSGAYAGNELLSDARIEGKLTGYVPAGLLRWLRHSLAEKLSRRFRLYDGYAGVDMMICGTPGEYRIHPCVEINMRMNMGMVARIFHTRYMRPGAEGKLVVDYFKEPGGALAFHRKMQRESPLRVENGKILSGYLSLTPVTKTTGYNAYVNVL